MPLEGLFYIIGFVCSASLYASLIVSQTQAQPAADEVKTLPGASESLTSRQYSGYLNASGTIKLHYWFVESERDPERDPLVLWLSGGPGCSSLFGYLAEIGPYQVNSDGETLSANNYSWTRLANVIFLESPAGVGFSYSADHNYTTNDDETSENNYLALLHFFEKFPALTTKALFLVSQSYGGIYVPTLGLRLMANKSINFQGFAIGNGLLDQDLNVQTAVYFAYNHGIIGEDLWARLQRYCCKNGTCSFSKASNLQCTVLLLEVRSIIFGCGINVYDITGDCYTGGGFGSTQESLKHSSYYPAAGFIKLPRNAESIPHRPTLEQSFPCLNTELQRNYFNRADVRQALHIPSIAPTWTFCTSLNYTTQYTSMLPQFNKLLAKHRALVYSGDVDLACNFLGCQKFVASLGLTALGERRPWTYEKQVAGFVKEYDQITFMTVKGAGHMVPLHSPGPAQQMMMNFLSNKLQ